MSEMPKPKQEKDPEKELRNVLVHFNRLEEHLETLKKSMNPFGFVAEMMGAATHGEEIDLGSKQSQKDQELHDTKESLKLTAKALGLDLEMADSDSGATVLFGGSGMYKTKDLYFVVKDQEHYLHVVELLSSDAQKNETTKAALEKLLTEHARTALRFVEDHETLINQFASLRKIAETVDQSLLPEEFQRLAYYEKRGILLDGVQSMKMDHMFFLVGCGDVSFERIKEEEGALLRFIDEIKNKTPESRALAIELLGRFIERINNNEKMWEEWGVDTNREFVKKVVAGVSVMTTKLDQLLADLKAEEG